MKKLTVTIPCFNQKNLLIECLNSLCKQTYKDFSVLIIDDCSKEDYTDILKTFPGLDIKYIRNEGNLGAMKNMFKAIKYPVDTEYVLCLHEDDAIASIRYFEDSVKLMDENRDVVFTAGKPIWFKKTIPPCIDGNNNKYISGNITSFVDLILDYEAIIFGSIIYRKESIKVLEPELNKYHTLCDRPFLISSLKGEKRFALFDNPIIFVRDHGISDKRSSGLRQEHLFNLLIEYKKYTRNDKLFIKFSTNVILNNYIGLKKMDLPLFKYISKTIKLGLFRFSGIRIYGLVSIPFYILGDKNMRRLIYLIKK
ncbi:MAG: glycosyltransferase [Candidatus Taylorbacteria bacterium]|nr:glycosyltransferase [Candidatus Taylorbacteria bacterium]